MLIHQLLPVFASSLRKNLHRAHAEHCGQSRIPDTSKKNLIHGVAPACNASLPSMIVLPLSC